MDNRIYEYLRTIPPGKVVTYGQIAEYLGNRHLSRHVGNVLHRNRDGEKYPCFKVVNARGELAKHFGFGGLDGQKARLEGDGIPVNDYKVDLSLYQWKP